MATTTGQKLLESFNNVKQGTNKLLQKYPVAPGPTVQLFNRFMPQQPVSPIPTPPQQRPNLVGGIQNFLKQAELARINYIRESDNGVVGQRLMNNPLTSSSIYGASKLAKPMYTGGKAIGDMINLGLESRRNQSVTNSNLEQAKKYEDLASRTTDTNTKLRLMRQAQSLYGQNSQTSQSFVEKQKPVLTSYVPKVGAAMVNIGEAYSGAGKIGAGGLALSAGLGGGIAKLFNQDVNRGIGEGIASGVTTAGVTRFTQPFIAALSGQILSKAPEVAKKALGAAVAGITNVYEDELITRLNGQIPQMGDRVLSFALSAAFQSIPGLNNKTMTWKEMVDEYAQMVSPQEKQVIKSVINQNRDAIGRYAKELKNKFKGKYMVNGKVMTLAEMIKQEGGLKINGSHPGFIDFGAEISNPLARTNTEENINNALGTGRKFNKVTAPDNQSGRTPSAPVQNPSMLGKPNQGQMQATTKPQSQLQTQAQIPLKPDQGFSSEPIIPQGTTRGFTESVQQAPNVAPEVKAKVNSTYTRKPNPQLMGEAQALLQEGASIKLNNVEGIDKKIAATIQEAINKQKTNPELAANLYNNLSEQGTELGRGVQALSLLQRMSPEAIAMSAASKIKAYNRTARVKIPELGGEQLTMLTKMVDKISKLKVGTREHNIAVNELQNTINKFIPSSIADKALTLWKAGLLTSLRTTERNLFGNSVHAIAETIKDLPATVADMLMSMATKKRTLTPTVMGMGEFASKQTAQQISDVIKLGYDASADISKFDHKTINWGNNPIEKAAKLYTNIVFRSLGAQDKPFFNSAFKRSLFSQAGAEAINAGKEGNRQFINSLVSKPTVEMIKTAIEDANTATFKSKNSASAIANSIKRELAKVKIGDLEVGKIMGEVAMPFTGVPSSILGQVVSYSPAGLLKGIVDVGRVATGSVPELQRKAAQELGRGVIGTGIFALGAYLASKGLITGQPKDAAEQRQWDLENKPRNSILLGGKWRSLNSIGPESIVFLAGSKFQEEMNKPEGSLGAYGGNLAKDYLDQSFVTGLQQPVNVITDPARYGKSYAGSMLSSGVPNIIKDAAKATDTVQRESNTIGDYAKLAIPGLRQTLIEKRDVLGNTMKQEPTGLGAFLDLFNSKTPVNNAVVNELGRLQSVGENATPSKLTPNQTILKQKVKLTFDQLNNLEKGVGEALRPQLQALIQSPTYQALNDEDKSQAIDNLVQRVRKQYKGVNGESIISGNGSTPAVTGNQTPIYITDENGNVKEIKRNFTEKPPKLTGIKEIDKNKISTYKSKITSRIKDLGELLDRGEMSREDVITELNSLIKLKNAITTASGGGKKMITDAELMSAYKKLLEAVYKTPKLRTSSSSKNITQPIRLKRQAIKSLR